jgi:selenocysteine lyase/cysteine desulfurase
LLGPSGVGFLYAKDPDSIDSLYEGGSGVNALARIHPEASPVKFEAGTLNYLGISGLYSSLGYLMRVGRETIYNRCMQVTHEALNQLESLPGIHIYGTKRLDRKVPIIAFNASGYFSTEAAYLLNEHKIAVRAGLHCAPLAHEAIGTAPHGTIRASFGHLNSLQDVGCLIEAMKSIVTKIAKKNPSNP